MGLRQVKGLVCVRCGKRHGERASGCDECGPQGLLEHLYDLADAALSLDREALGRREPWMWRYRELLPLDELAETPNLQVGMTPVFGAPRLASWLGIGGLWLKDEGRSPTGSLEDRASALCVAQARDASRKVVAVASGGAAAPSLACFAASTGLRAVIFAGEDSREDDLRLASLFGATVLGVDGGPSAASELCSQACRELKWFDASPGATAFPFEAKKTVGHEVAEQLAEKMPDWVVVCDDEGTTIAAVARGLQEMRALKIARPAPKLLHVARSTASRGEDPLWQRAQKAVRESEGAGLAVTAEAVAQVEAEAARRAALAVDESGARALAGLKSAVAEGVVKAEETALVLVSGRRGAAPGPARRIEVGRELARVEKAMTQAGLGS